MVDGPRRLSVGVNGNNGYIMKMLQFDLVNNSTFKSTPVPIPLSLPHWGHPRASHQHVSPTPEITSRGPISILAAGTPSTQQHWYCLHGNHATTLLKTLQRVLFLHKIISKLLVLLGPETKSSSLSINSCFFNSNNALDFKIWEHGCPEERLHFPTSLAAGCGERTNSWPTVWLTSGQCDRSRSDPRILFKDLCSPFPSLSFWWLECTWGHKPQG